jgi:hypothetical protein
MSHSRLAPVALIGSFLLALFPACDGASDPSDPTELSCTLVACSDVVSVNFGDFTGRFGDQLPAEISLCLDERPCQQTTVQLDEGEVRCSSTPALFDDPTCFFVDGELSVVMALGGSDEVTGWFHSLRVTLVGADGDVLLNQVVIPAFTEHRPNGPLCEPVCHSSKSEL